MSEEAKETVIDKTIFEQLNEGGLESLWNESKDVKDKRKQLNALARAKSVIAQQIIELTEQALDCEGDMRKAVEDSLKDPKRIKDLPEISLKAELIYKKRESYRRTYKQLFGEDSTN